MLTLIPKKARLRDVLSLADLIEDSRDDLERARHALAQAQGHVRGAELAVGTSSARFESIVALYNRLVVEYEPQDRPRR